MKRLDLVLNGKGGVGKRFFAVNFVQFLKDKGITHVAIDSDNENSTLKRFHSDIRFLDLDNRREVDGTFAALEKAQLMVMDCRAASTDLFIDYFAEIDLAAVLATMDAKLTLIMPVNHEADSVDQVQRLAEEFGAQASYLVVRNAAHSDSFALFESSEVRAQLKNKLGGWEIAMTRSDITRASPLLQELRDHAQGDARALINFRVRTLVFVLGINNPLAEIHRESAHVRTYPPSL